MSHGAEKSHLKTDSCVTRVPLSALIRWIVYLEDMMMLLGGVELKISRIVLQDVM